MCHQFAVLASAKLCLDNAVTSWKVVSILKYFLDLVSPKIKLMSSGLEAGIQSQKKIQHFLYKAGPKEGDAASAPHQSP